MSRHAASTLVDVAPTIRWVATANAEVARSLFGLVPRIWFNPPHRVNTQIYLVYSRPIAPLPHPPPPFTRRLIEIEDIFVTGFCRHETGLRYRHIDKFGQTFSWQTECKLRYLDTWQIHKVLG